MNTDKIYAESIANEYSPKDDSKVVALKKLDRKAKQGPRIIAYTIGGVSTLLLGIGMCYAMGVLGAGNTALFIMGIIAGVVGIAGVCVNYPIFKKLKADSMQKYANDIMLLAKEITEDESM